MKNLILSIKNLIFKDGCIICKNENVYGNLCESCYKTLKYQSSIKRRGNLFYIWKYEGIVKHLIESFKLKSRINIKKDFAALIGEQLKFIIESNMINVVIPIPISSRRESERGFNQIEEILKMCDIKYLKIKRLKKTKHMYSILNEKKRAENIKNSFYIDEKMELNGKNILIVDDIVTTGATFKELKNCIEKQFIPENITFFSITASKYSIYKGVDINGTE